MKNVEFVSENAFCPVTLGGLAVTLKVGEDEIVCMGFLENESTMFNFYPKGDKVHFRKDYELESEDPKLFKKCKQIIVFAEDEFKLRERAEKYYTHYNSLYDKEMELLENHISEIKKVDAEDPEKRFSKMMELKDTFDSELAKVRKETELIKKCIIVE